jgi:hypothetical protein
MLSETATDLPEEEIGKIAQIIVQEADIALGALGGRFEQELCHYSVDIRYRAVAIGLIRMLGDHLINYARLTSTESAVAIAVEYLEKHIEETLVEADNVTRSQIGNA